MPASGAASPDSGEVTGGKAVLLGRYEMGRFLGCGAFAKVYHARDLRSGHSVAVKSISKARVAKSGLAGHVKREIEVMRRLRHPYIVRLHEVLASRSKIHFVMEYAKGGELFARVARAGRLPEDLCRKYFQQLISAVGYCHCRGVFHRDIKPENLLLDEHGDLKVSDFGLSAIVAAPTDDSQPSTPSMLHTLCGTPAYVAPEILAKKGYDGAKVDLWSCGVILFILGAGYLPFNDSNLMAMYRKIYKGEFRCPRWMSVDMKRMIFRLLDTNPETRITVEEIIRDPWFAKGFKEVEFKFYEEEPKEEEEPDRSLNAFDIISFSSGFDLSPLLNGESEDKCVAAPGAGWERFVSEETAGRVLERVEEVGREVGVEVRRKAGKGWRVDMEGQNGNFSAAVTVRPLWEGLVVVEIKKRAGEMIWREKVRPQLDGLIYRRPEPRLPLPADERFRQDCCISQKETKLFEFWPGDLSSN